MSQQRARRTNVRPKRKNNQKNKRNNTNPIKQTTYGKVLRMPSSFPDTVIVNLSYQDTIMNRNNVGGLICSWRYRINSAFDPDPLLGTGSISGFTEWAAVFTHYRILTFMFDVQIANDETFPLMIATAPTLTDLGANFSGFDQLPEVPYGRKQLVSAKGGADKCRLRGRVSIPKLEGSKEPITDSGFAAQVSTNPLQIRFFNVGFTGGANPLVNGVFVSIRLRFTCQFFARLPIFS